MVYPFSTRANVIGRVPSVLSSATLVDVLRSELHWSIVMLEDFAGSSAPLSVMSRLHGE